MSTDKYKIHILLYEMNTEKGKKRATPSLLWGCHKFSGKFRLFTLRKRR